MKLILEVNEKIKILEEGTAKKKDFYIEGIFMSSEIKNKNGRIYPKTVLENELNRYNREFVSKNRAFGELGHPANPVVNLERISHLIKEMKFDGDHIIGKAKIMDTPYGNIAKNLIKEGATLGVSSRGLGTTKEEKGVTHITEYYLSAVDIVADPSAPAAFVQGIMEDKEWVLAGGAIREKDVEAAKKHISKKKSLSLDEQCAIFTRMLSKITGVDQ